MKKLSIIAAFAALALFGMACTKVEANGELATRSAQIHKMDAEVGILVNLSEIDPSIMQFVETHFPQTGILFCHQTQHYYKVKLHDQTELKFNRSFEWVEVDCEHSRIYTRVPESIVPEPITIYVVENFPNNFIEEIEKKDYGWKVELNHDREIKFDHNFEVINGGGNGGGGNGGGNSSNYPEINTFVDTYFSQVGIRKVERDGNKYEVELTDNTDIDFKLNFEWMKIDCDDSNVYGSVPTELVPTQITDYVVANFPNNHIDQIEKKDFGWEIELNNDHEIKFDHNFNVISGGGNGGGGNGGGGNGGGNNSNYPEINTFVDTYFSQVGIRKVERDGNKYEVELTDNTDIDFKLNFEWMKIDCDDSNVYGSVPTELVPTQITDYVVANFPNNHIDQIEKKDFGWEIELNNDHEIKFDHNFNVISGGGNGGGGNGGGGNGGGNNSNYPEINTFVDNYFPQVSIRKVKRDGNKYEVELTDNTEIDFNLSFEWKKIDCEESQVYGMVPTELVPEPITAYVTANFPGKHIDSIEKKNNGYWEIELNNGLEIIFDSNFNFIGIDDKK